jgi:predicted nucleotide-binding protein
VALFLERLGIEPVILHEQANRGATLIEKLERNSDVQFAVVLLTPDDEGRLVAPDEVLRPRARQNVVLELGYFVGRLGRAKVCALYGGEIELPSDWHGVIWVALDDRGAWKMELFRELRAAGFSVDMNRVV